MATPSPSYNPDRRPLPDGWITRYDDNYRAWYYVDTRTHPPRSSWEHPLGPIASTPSTSSFAPPPNPPPSRENFGAGSQPYSQQGQRYPAGQQYNHPSSYAGGGGFPPNPEQPRGYQPPASSYQAQPYGGGPPGNYGNPGNPGWPQQGWQQQPPTQLGYQSQPASTAIQQPPRSGRNQGGVGLGTAAALGVGGLVVGGLLTEGFEHHEERERDEGYEQGFDQGYVDGADDFGGGNTDW